MKLFLTAMLLCSPLLALDDHDRDHHDKKVRVLRYYDRQGRDYHQWNEREDKAYKEYLKEQRREYKDWNKVQRKDQQNYWRWRHAHRDDDRQ